MTLFDAIVAVLKESGEPLHYEEITEKVLTRGLWRTDGVTPERTVSAALTTHLQQHGPRSVVQRLGRGYYALSVFTGDIPNITHQPHITNQRQNDSDFHHVGRGSLSFADAAERVLRLNSDQEPMTASQITHKALELGLISTRGKTPDATMSARIYVEIKNGLNGGRPSRFTKVGRGVFGLTDWEPSNDRAQPQDKDNELSHDDQIDDTIPFADAAELVLEQFGHQEPMHFSQITARALKEGLIVTEGRTPESTMSAQLLTEIQRSNRRGERSRFVTHGRGYFGLTRWTEYGLSFQIEQHNRSVQDALLEWIRQIDPVDFESLVGRLLTALGFEDVVVTNASGDGGIDVRGTLVVGDVIRTRMAVQVKRWKQNVQAPTVQQVRGSLGAHEQGLIITTSDFSSGARDEAKRPDATPVGLMHGEQFVSLLIEHDIGVHRSTHDLIELGEGDSSV